MQNKICISIKNTTFKKSLKFKAKKKKGGLYSLNSNKGFRINNFNFCKL